jgi:NAD(P)-dependent dehydrogenase (short-subunit alcohol dehydrogenase family)
MLNWFSQSPQSDSVVITGASTGIGAACALALDKLGYRVFAGVRHPADGERLQQQAGPRLMPIRLDVTDAASISAASHTVAAMVGERGLAGLVNNAGIGVAGPIELLPLADWRRQFEVNVFGLIAVTQTFLPLIRTGRGRIINMGSIAGRASMPFMAPYAASKHALEAITDALRLELQPWGIRVALIAPGAIATPIWKNSERSRCLGRTWGQAFRICIRKASLASRTRPLQPENRHNRRASWPRPSRMPCVRGGRKHAISSARTPPSVPTWPCSCRIA